MAKRLKRSMLCIWVILCTIGLGAVSLHSFDGVVADSPKNSCWPQDSRLVQDDRERLVIFIHPQCPCTIATLSELEAILVRKTVPTTCVISATDPEWLTSKVMQQIKKLQTHYSASIDIFLDTDGSEGERFEAIASGHCMYFDRHGKKVFSGGITASRGHVGDSDARYRLLELIQMEPDGVDVEVVNCFPVFGCRLPTNMSSMN